MTTIRQVLRDAAQSLEALPHGSPELEAAVLLCHLLGKPRSFLFAWPDKTLSDQQTAAYLSLIDRRLQGEPIAHITGIREFWSMTLKVSPDTLIPRPETELLVEQALEHLQEIPSAKVVDLGTGSGAIALAIASERPDCHVDATDRSESALKIAGENARSLALRNISFHLGVWFDALPETAIYDLILSNPPYIAEQDPHLNQGDLPREPVSALVAGTDGLRDIRTLVSQASNHLEPGGWLLIEHGFEQAASVRDLLHQAGFRKIKSLKDLAGHERITQGHKPGI